MVRASLKSANKYRNSVLLAYFKYEFVVNISRPGRMETRLVDGNHFFEGITIVPSILSEFKE